MNFIETSSGPHLFYSKSIFHIYCNYLFISKLFYCIIIYCMCGVGTKEFAILCDLCTSFYEGDPKVKTSSILQNWCRYKLLLMRFLNSTVLIYYAKTSGVYKLIAVMKIFIYDLLQIVVSPLMPAIEQRYSIRFGVLLGKSPTETNQLLSEAYATQALSRARMFE